MRIQQECCVTVAICCAILSVGCVPVLPPDPAIVVSGEIVDMAGAPIENCRLTIFPYGETDPYGYNLEQRVQSRFKVSFGHVRPDSDYRAVIECSGDEPVSVIFRAEPSPADKDSPYRSVDLGTIRVGKAP